jgi:hypothetical protein
LADNVDSWLVNNASAPLWVVAALSAVYLACGSVVLVIALGNSGMALFVGVLGLATAVAAAADFVKASRGMRGRVTKRALWIPPAAFAALLLALALGTGTIQLALAGAASAAGGCAAGGLVACVFVFNRRHDAEPTTD